MNIQCKPLGVKRPQGKVSLAQMPFVLITGGKGGVGKSTLAANLGVQLGMQRRRVLLVDLDLGLANLNVLLRLPAGPTLEDALAGRATFEECVVPGPGGVHVLPGGSGNADMGRPDDERRDRLLGGLKRLAAGYDVVLADSAAGIGPDVLAFATAARHVWVVTTPQPASLTDAYGLIKALHTYGLEVEVEVPTPEIIVNLAGGLEEAETTARKLRSVCEQFLLRSPRRGGWMPRSRAIALSSGNQLPFALDRRNSLELSCLRQLSGRLGRIFDAVPSPSTL